ncbi:haloacid dehalogenase [Desulfurococcaceae archaeon MEX13E-LK6-19]|nr:haloacid dehalogenase [Desulfurococcaceae archaeon MEX13E-LK6-19]
MERLSRIVENILSEDISVIDNILNVKDNVRENAIKLSRDIIRASAEVTRLIHLKDFSSAKEKLSIAQDKARELIDLLKDHPDLFYSGLVYNCLSEFVEAYIVYNLIVAKRMPSYKELAGIPYIPYLQGLGDTIGEIRRYIIDLLKDEKYEEAREYLDVIENMYQVLKKLHYPDALTPGLRHKVDVARRLIEDTKVLYVNTITASRLRKSLEKVLESKT